ncbi:MAG TPA: hypothetical protein ENG83_06915 [Nitrospirae bacterium]|nr:hypothetical protein BMS3Abin06_02363 [bacterium BMS3Abin06]HDH11911.1 hypothetical protein [Nitrospirota bacterium]
MKKIKQRNGRLPLLLITAILTLCAGFLIVGCGTDPVLKVKDVNKGAYAVDFNNCPGDYCYGNSATDPILDISDKEITFEAMVKKNTGTAVTGAVFSRLNTSSGAVLYVKDDEPTFAMRVGWIDAANPDATSTASYIVGSNFTLVQDAWTHIAGVIANTAHTHTAILDCTTTVMAETPHLDIYVNGDFKNCNTTWGYDVGGVTDPATGPQYADSPGSNKVYLGKIEDSTDANCVDPTTDSECNTLDSTIYQNTNLNAVVDELRLWTTARTAAQISECKDKELGISGGNCYRGDSNLAVYYRLNEGTANLTTDFSGNGFGGTFYYTDSAGAEHSWDASWVAGNGVTGAD